MGLLRAFLSMAQMPSRMRDDDERDGEFLELECLLGGCRSLQDLDL